MENQITFHVSAGEEMPDMLLHLRLEDMCRSVGRIQSREYMKKITETESQKRVAYEVSVSKLECMDE